MDRCKGLGVPRIDDVFLDCVVYLYPSHADAENGAAIGGTGFVIGIPAKSIPNSHFLFVVTNRHVIDAGSCIVRLNLKSGGTDILDVFGNWEPHHAGDDLAFCPIGPGDEHKFGFVSSDTFLTKDYITQFEIGPGDDVFVVGRFISHEGRQRNLPSVRFGNIAQMPWEPIKRDDEFMQESFLVEARSIGGYSGSPVFVHIPPFALRPRRGHIGSRSYGPFLLGVDWAHLNDWKPVCNRSGTPVGKPDWRDMQVGSNTGMMCVVPAWKITEFFARPEMVARIAAEEERKLERRGAPVATSDHTGRPRSEPPATDENPRHKEDFTSLVSEVARKHPRVGRTLRGAKRDNSGGKKTR